MIHSRVLFAIGLIIYLLVGRLVMRFTRNTLRDALLAGLNLASVFIFLFYNGDNGSFVDNLAKFAGYVLLVVFQYLLLYAFAEAKGWRPWLAFYMPLAALIIVRYAYGEVFGMLEHLVQRDLHGIPNLIGISYLAFRCSRLVLEVRDGSVKTPGLCQYLAFAFFFPTMSLGPINTYANFQRGFDPEPWQVSAPGAALRILIGLVKYQFLGGIFSQLTYSAFLLDGHPHYWIDLPIVMIFYYLFLYCNFSGFCDIAIGAAALIGIPVLENFNNPFAARNIREFWSRWHITLSQWMRDIVFAPLSEFLAEVMGPSNINHAMAITVFVVFLLIGIWHGVGWNYAIFGAVQAFGVVTNHYYTIALKKRLGREGFKAYMANRWIHAAAVTATFLFYTASLIFFANTLPQIREIFYYLR